MVLIGEGMVQEVLDMPMWRGLEGVVVESKNGVERSRECLGGCWVVSFP